MSASNSHPTQSRLVALLDGEIAPADAEAMRAHLAACDACREAHQEMLAVREILAADAGSVPLRPVWPAVRERLSPRPRLTPTFAFGAALAAVAGVVLGLSLETLQPNRDATQTTIDDLWTSLGTSLGSDAGLYDLYFGELEKETP